MEQALQATNGLGKEHTLTVALNNKPATQTSTTKPFIEANTIESSLEEIQSPIAYNKTSRRLCYRNVCSCDK